LFSKVEDDGYMINGHAAHPVMKSKLRGLRDANGVPLFRAGMTGASVYDLDGEPMKFANNGAFDKTAALLISGDWKQLVYAIREDLTYKILDQAVIQDDSGDIVYNLAQQDMVALRCKMRLGWQCPNPANRMQATEGNRYPIAVLKPSA
jgi:HK97 family phage major capsid protein